MELITSADTAELLGVTRWHVSRLVREGYLTPAAQAPGARGAFLFDPATVAEFAETRRTA